MLVNIKKAGKRCGALCLVMLAGITAPFVLWAVNISHFRQVYLEWRAMRNGLVAGKLACSLSSDCPPGYRCLDGRCVPVMAEL